MTLFSEKMFWKIRPLRWRKCEILYFHNKKLILRKSSFLRSMQICWLLSNLSLISISAWMVRVHFKNEDTSADQSKIHLERMRLIVRSQKIKQKCLFDFPTSWLNSFLLKFFTSILLKLLKSPRIKFFLRFHTSNAGFKLFKFRHFVNCGAKQTVWNRLISSENGSSHWILGMHEKCTVAAAVAMFFGDFFVH